MATGSIPSYLHGQQMVCLGWLKPADGSDAGFLYMQPQQLTVAGWLALVPVEVDIYFRRTKRIYTVGGYRKSASAQTLLKTATLNSSNILKSTLVTFNRLETASEQDRVKDAEYIGGESPDP